MIQDTGVGISQEVQQNLFKFDKHISTRGTAQEKGAGLGLKFMQGIR
jgi:signal transduction histidine kinase